MSNRTIAAIATPMGEGGIAVIRISGDDAAAVADRVFSARSGKKLAEQKGYTALFGDILLPEGKDSAVALRFKAPNSYTGEDVVEISIHGGRYIAKSALRLILSNGAIAAEPGEFTRRAFLNGKLNLIEAEAVMGVISAESQSELKLSVGALGGKVAVKIAEIKASLVAAAASIAAYSDYPDEDLPELTPDNFLNMLHSAKAELKKMLDDFDAGKVIREGLDTAIVGKPNVGKSTLMNLLSGYRRSIVTDIAGTTRDIIEDTVRLGDITLRLSDTAGIHSTENEVEKLGVELARHKLAEAQLVLAVFDASRELDKNDIELIELLNAENTIIVINKTDVRPWKNGDVFGKFKTVEISAKTGAGADALSAAVLEISGAARLNPDSAVLGTERQRAAAARALSAANAAIDALNIGHTVDAVGVCIDDALSALYELTGERVTNTVTDEIFKRFCVGK